MKTKNTKTLVDFLFVYLLFVITLEMFYTPNGDITIFKDSDCRLEHMFNTENS